MLAIIGLFILAFLAFTTAMLCIVAVVYLPLRALAGLVAALRMPPPQMTTEEARGRALLAAWRRAGGRHR